MMYTPRSYLQQSPPSPRSRSDRMGSRARNLPTPRSVKPAQKPLSSSTLSLSSPEPKLVQPPTTMHSHTHSHSHSHSKPVVIPPRMPSRTASAPQAVRARGHNASRPARTHSAHNADAIPPAVAALLAVTSIPQMPQRRRKPAMADRRISMDELIQEWKQDDSDVPPSVVGSPLDLLLGRVDESEEEYGSLQSMEQEKGLFSTSRSRSRSISSESLTTLPPSLDYDDPSFSSHWDNISTPDSISRKSLPERKERLVSSPPKEDCVLDHPLLHYGPEECEDIIATDVTEAVDPLPPTTERFKSFKSNLTASIQALKSAAKSFSNFTAPSVPPDDFLTRSLLAPKFTSEMRPKHVEGLPSPALRRYLNPHSAPTSPTELSMQLHDALMIDTDAEPHAPMIQMQTYDRRGRSKSRRRSLDPHSEAGRALSTPPAVRQREPRENCDFLRVIVLEMNMRRVGKLDAKAIGKARIWLPPRKLGPSKAPAFHSSVPDRWIGIAA